MDNLLGCPFCGCHPATDVYPTFIRIYCASCKDEDRNVDVFGDGHYSAWARTQEADENGMIRIAAELDPVSDTEAFKRLADKWNKRHI